ncbi:hypothetical protein HY839_00645 [Candidatus Azambacteria bacterium]|nr:hypothetical protein [Candidatus Azambacteria bacterium]
MHTCTLCPSTSPKFALPLKRENGKWAVKPVCGTCRYNLSKEARSQKKFIPFYGLEASLKEAEQRNAALGKYKPFITAFARANVRKDKPTCASRTPEGRDRPLKAS